MILEFYTRSRGADAYAVIWLHNFEDNEEVDIDIPIWNTNNGMRLTQNCITEENFNCIPDIKIEEIGRLQFSARFKAGTDEDHARFITDNKSRETQETWEACYCEGVRARQVTKDLPPAVQALHDESLIRGRDVLNSADESEKKQWLSKDVTDWSGAFGSEPAKYMDWHGPKSSGRDARDSNREVLTRSHSVTFSEIDEESEDDHDSEASEASPKGSDPEIQDFENDTHRQDDRQEQKSGRGKTGSLVSQIRDYREESKVLHGKQKGLMQWKPMRNLRFVKNEAKVAARKTINKTKLEGREPDVETES